MKTRCRALGLCGPDRKAGTVFLSDPVLARELRDRGLVEILEEGVREPPAEAAAPAPTAPEAENAPQRARKGAKTPLPGGAGGPG